MSRIQVRVDPDDPQSWPRGRVDHAVLDGTTDRDLSLQQQEDDAEAMRDMAQYARRVRAPGTDAGGAGASHRCAARDDP